MTYRTKGLQTSLLVHGAVLLAVWWISGSMGQAGKVTTLDLSILQGARITAQEVVRDASHTQPIQEKTEPMKEMEASVDGTMPAPPAAPVRSASPARSDSAVRNENSAEAVEFGSANGPFYHHQVMPVYPSIARKMGKEGKVLLRLTIDARGTLLNVEVLEDPGYGFAEAAIRAVKKSTFIPARNAGNPVFAKALLPIKFVLE